VVGLYLKYPERLESPALRFEMDGYPRVSVIIPTFNRFPMVCEAIDSVLSQTHREFELIVVDDGSTDETGAIAERYKGRLRYIYQENRGASAARNRGVAESHGDLIAFLDSDDLWLSGKLEVQGAVMADPDVRISYTEEIWYRRGVRVNPGNKHAKYSGSIFEKCLPLCLISPSSVMMEKSLFGEVGGFDEDLPVCEDYDLWLRITKDWPVRLIEQPLIVKRNGHPGQLSASGWGFDRYRVQAIQRLLTPGSLQAGQADLARKVLKNKCNILSKGFRKRGNLDQAQYFESLGGV
jgi:glycosyltransferase involved in cell wall biosynthesis